MGLLDRLLGRKEAQSSAGTAVAEPECLHAALVPHWDQPEDMGNAERISSYKCESCHEMISRAEGDRRAAAAAQHIRVDDELRVTSETSE